MTVPEGRHRSSTVALGAVASMPVKFTLTDHFDASPEELFRAITDLAQYENWMPNFVRIDRITDGELRVGTRFRETRRMFGREATEEFEVTAFDPPRCLELFIDGTKGTSRKGHYRFQYHLEPRGPDTTLIVDAEIGGISKASELVARLFVGGMKKAIAKDHTALKHHLAEQAPSSPDLQTKKAVREDLG